MSDEPGHRGPFVCGVVGISYRQLDYWARTGLVAPSVSAASGSGSQRLYSTDDVVLLGLVKEMLDNGMSLQSTRKALHEVEQVVVDHDGRQLWLVVSPYSGDVQRVAEGHVEPAIRIALAPVVVVIDVSRVIHNVKTAIEVTA